MTNGPRYVVKYRRRRKGLTNYKKRLKLLKSGMPRLVVRRSNNTISCQIVKYNPTGDEVIVSFSSNKLIKYGYKGHTGNIPAAYLAGFACGLIALKKGIKDVVFDSGLFNLTKGCKIYAALKGAVDSGLNIPHDEKVFPQERVVQGYHISNYAKILKADKPERYEKVFSKMLKNNFEPENFVEHFQEIKKRIAGEHS